MTYECPYCNFPMKISRNSFAIFLNCANTSHPEIQHQYLSFTVPLNNWILYDVWVKVSKDVWFKSYAHGEKYCVLQVNHKMISVPDSWSYLFPHEIVGKAKKLLIFT